MMRLPTMPVLPLWTRERDNGHQPVSYAFHPNNRNEISAVQHSTMMITPKPKQYRTAQIPEVEISMATHVRYSPQAIKEMQGAWEIEAIVDIQVACRARQRVTR